MSHAIDLAIRILRTGEELHVTSLADLGPSLVDCLKRLKTVHDGGNVVVERKSRRRSDRDLLDMLLFALPKLRKGMSAKQAAENARGHGRPPNERTPDEVAKVAWTDMGIRTNARALKMPEMKGWYQRLAYKTFGPSGRPRNKLPKRRKAKRK